MAISPFIAAINQICDEKGISKESVIETIEAALAAAYRKDYGEPGQIIVAKLDPESGETQFSRVFNIVENEEDVEEPDAQKTVAEARKLKKNIEAGQTIEFPLETHSDFGRIAAQTAKQVVTQRLRETERDMLYSEFKDKEGLLINGVIQQVENGNVVIDLGKINGIMLPFDQVKNERYYSGQRLKVFVKAVEESSRGPRILVSRAEGGLVQGLFENEVPEIASGSVEIKGIAREAGSRSKVAVYTEQEGLDPVGSCVGQRGSRIQAVLAELGDEKIDIILWNADEKQFIINALSPAKVSKVTLNEKEKRAQVLVPEDQFSLAIGTGGQNVRLASKLTGWSLDFEKVEETKEGEAEEATAEEEVKPKKKSIKKAKTEEITETEPVEETAQIEEEVTPEIVEEATSEEASQE
ncbi:MAG: transcription termination factor NusA [Candidatus Berkelbacteria bacterium]